MARKQKTQAERDYEKQVRRIEQFIRRAEKRGYRFEAGVLPPRPKKITQGSVRRLQKITPTKLYEKAQAISEETGHVVSGIQARKEERRAVALKAAETRKRRKAKIKEEKKQEIEKEKKRESITFENEPGFDEARRKKDELDKKRLEQDTENEFSAGKLTYNRLQDMINTLDKLQYIKSAGHLQKELDKQISEYGFDLVMQSIGNAPERFWEDAEIAIMYHIGSQQHTSAIYSILNLIQGSIPNSEESRAMQESIEEDDYV